MSPARLILALAALVLATGAQSGPGLERLHFEHLTAERLGSAASVQCGLQDDLGQIWLGTNDGLLRYDGRRGQRFGSDPRDPGSLNNPWVQALLMLPEGQLLVATAGGLNRFDTRSYRNERIDLPGQREPVARTVLSLAPADGTRVWLQTHFELMQFEPRDRSFTPVPLPGLQPLAAGRRILLTGLISDGQGGVWLVAGRELVHVDAAGQLLQRWPVPPPRSGKPAVRSLVLDADGQAWIGGDGWLQVISTRDGRPSDLPERLGLPASTVHALLRDRDDAVWIGYGGAGLWRWPRGAARAEAYQRHAALPSSLYSNAISALLQDRSGVLWVGTWSSGMSQVDLRNVGFTSYRSVEGDGQTLSHDTVLAVQADGAEHAWVATYGGGLNRLHLPSGRAEPIDARRLPMTYLKALLLQPGRGLWVAGDGGLYLFDTQRRSAKRIEPMDTAGNASAVNALALGADGTLWAGSSAGLYQLDRQGVLRLHRRQEGVAGALHSEAVQTLHFDRNGRLWIGTAAGLQLWQAGKGFSQPLQPSADMAKPEALKVMSLREDAAGRLWLGSQLGLYEVRPVAEGAWQLKSWQGLAGMPPGPVFGLENGPDGALWMSGDKGLSRLDPERRRLLHYPARHHHSQGFSPGASWAAADGSLFYGGQGLVHFHPAALRDNTAAPSVLLADVRIFNRSLREAPTGPSEPGQPAADLASLGVQGPLERATALYLTHREAMVSFDLRAQHFHAPALLRYAWKLEGFDTGWIEGPPGEGLATYTNLDAGNFRLLAKAANPDGHWGEPRELLRVDVRPPWWRSLWFRSLAALLLLAGLATAWQLRLRHLKRTQRRLETEVERRTAEVQAQRQQIATLSEIGRELTATLDLEAIKSALMQHLAGLMPATAFGVGLVLHDERAIQFEVMVEQGRRYKPYRRSLDAHEQPAVRCVSSGEPLWMREFEHDNRMVDAQQRQTEGERLLLETGDEPARARSALYVPLKIKGEVVGVLAALSDKADAFSQTHLDMLQTLGAYAAVALDNADAYRQLQAAQSQLVEQRKLASLGHLVAGVAHELNTPLGNGLLAATTLCDDANRFVDGLEKGQLRRSELQSFRESLRLGGELLLRSLETAGRLVTSFKRLAVDQASESRRSFDLGQLAEELRRARASGLSEGGHRLDLAVPAGLLLDSFPGSLLQVLEQLLDNAVEHGLAGRAGGRLLLTAEPVGAGKLRLRFSDDGVGIQPEVLARVFDPFFTTRFGRGSNGLGLHLAYTLVHSLLGGQISVSSTPGQGAVFEILLPRVAPR